MRDRARAEAEEGESAPSRSSSSSDSGGFAFLLWPISGALLTMLDGGQTFDDYLAGVILGPFVVGFLVNDVLYATLIGGSLDADCRTPGGWCDSIGAAALAGLVTDFLLPIAFFLVASAVAAIKQKR